MSAFFRNVNRLVALLIAGFLLYTFGLPLLLGDTEVRVDRSNPHHELCMKVSKRADALQPVSPAMEGVIHGTANLAAVGNILDNEQKSSLALINKSYNDCLAAFASLPKTCYDAFNADYRSKGFDPEKYANVRKEVVKKCVAGGEVEVTCKQKYTGRDVDLCIKQKLIDVTLGKAQ